MKTVGNTILEFRKINGFTQTDLAKSLHVTEKTIAKWETNTEIPNINIAKEMCELFYITLERLFDDNYDSPLEKAVLYSDFSIYYSLKEAGFNFKQPDAFGYTLVDYIIKYQNIDLFMEFNKDFPCFVEGNIIYDYISQDIEMYTLFLHKFIKYFDDESIKFGTKNLFNFFINSRINFSVREYEEGAFIDKKYESSILLVESLFFYGAFNNIVTMNLTVARGIDVEVISKRNQVEFVKSDESVTINMKLLANEIDVIRFSINGYGLDVIVESQIVNLTDVFFLETEHKLSGKNDMEVNLLESVQIKECNIVECSGHTYQLVGSRIVDEESILAENERKSDYDYNIRFKRAGSIYYEYLFKCLSIKGIGIISKKLLVTCTIKEDFTCLEDNPQDEFPLIVVGDVLMAQASWYLTSPDGFTRVIFVYDANKNYLIKKQAENDVAMLQFTLAGGLYYMQIRIYRNGELLLWSNLQKVLVKTNAKSTK